MTEVELREVTEDDLPILFEQQRDPDANRMAAFGAADPSDRAAFLAHQARIRSDDSNILRTVVCDGRVAGTVGSYLHSGERQVCYWIGREFWGRGIATAALRRLLDLIPERPLFASAAHDNAASIRVLQKCGFVITGRARGFSDSRGEEIDEILFTLGVGGNSDDGGGVQ